MDQLRTGKFIAAMRREQGLTQRQLAEALGISDKTVSKWETGHGLPEVGLMLPLCEMLGINVNELLSGQRLTEETYKQKAEENFMAILDEKQENKKRQAWTWGISIGTLALGFSIVGIAVFFEMPQTARVLLSVAALLVCVLGEAFACAVDRVTGYFRCRHCGELFVPDWKTYLKGSWSMLPGSGYLTCPHCGKAGRCKRTLER